jgi:transcriptional regulator with AAA-type ATPase domain
LASLDRLPANGGSANGSSRRGHTLASDVPVHLDAGDVIEIGQSLVIVQRDDLSGPTRPWTLGSHASFVDALERAPSPFAVLRLHVVAPQGVAQGVLSASLPPEAVVASFGPGRFELLVPKLSRDQGSALCTSLSSALVKAGARVQSGSAFAPDDGATAGALLAACAGPSPATSDDDERRDGAMTEIYRLVDRVAPSNINVLLLGETGVGKEVLAGEIHKRSRRAKGPLLRLNCAALTETLLESELFGHEKGAFTGAVKQKPGLLETARGGSVFLDEFGELPPSLQAKLLRVLEERQVLRVGAVSAIPIDVRFIFATNRDLDAEVARGAFREDLLYRVNAVSIVIPPLRERPSELEPLALRFAEDAARRDGREIPTWTPEAWSALRAWPFPGNIRELKNVVDRAILMAGDSPIDVAALGLGKKTASAPTKAPTPPSSSNEAPLLREERDVAEKRSVLDALERANGNQTQAAKLLGVSRRTLVTRLTAYGLTKPRKKREP